MPELPERTRLHHHPPLWVKPGAQFFITINARVRGSNALVRENLAPRLLDAAKHYHSIGTWWLELALIMPDHLHAIVAVPPDKRLAHVVTAWKSYQFKVLGIEWQSGFFDHRLRNQASAQEKWEYVRQNPVRAGLVQDPADWPYWWKPS